MSQSPGDDVVDERLSSAVIAYYGKGRSSYPRPDRGAVAAVLPRSDVASIVERIVALEREMYDVDVDWTSLGWRRGCSVALATLRQRHPELSVDALAALDWQFSYSTR